MTLDTRQDVSSPYAATAAYDLELGTTVVSLSYTDPREPARNLLVRVAPSSAAICIVSERASTI